MPERSTAGEVWNLAVCRAIVGSSTHTDRGRTLCPRRLRIEVATQSFSLPATLLDEVKEHAKLREQPTSGLVKEALEAHLVNLRLDLDAERMMATAPGGARRELAEIAAFMVP
jgi:hypothetical protein